MANNHINELIATDELFQLIQKENFVGWVFSLDYDNGSEFIDPHFCKLVEKFIRD